MGDQNRHLLIGTLVGLFTGIALGALFSDLLWNIFLNLISQ